MADKDLYHHTEQSSQSIQQRTGTLSEKETVAFRFGERDCNIFGEILLNDEEAATSYNKLLEESHSNRDYAQKNTTSWRDDETHLL